MITLKELRWNNCFSYGEGNHVQLDANTLTQILGSNGVGKSSIPLILEEVLYNKNSKGVKKADIPNRDINKGYSINLIFEKDGNEYEIDVVRKNSIKVKLFINGEDHSSHTATNTYKSIEELIGLDFKTFSQLVYQNTNASLQFLTATDANRKKFLIELLNLDEYTKLYDVFKVHAKVKSEELAKLSGQESTIISWLDNNKISSSSTLLPILENTISTEEHENQLRSFMVDLQNIENLNKKINENNEYKKQLANIKLNEINNASVTQLIDTNKLSSELGTLVAEKQQHTNFIEKIDSLGDHCPTCEQDITPEFKASLVNQEKVEVAELATKMDNIVEKLQAAKDNNAEFNKIQKVKKQWEELYLAIDKDLPEEIHDKETLQKKVQSWKTEIADLNKKKEEINKENLKRQKHNTRLKVISEQTESMEKDLRDVVKQKEQIEEEATNLELLKKAFSTNGLIAYKIENLVGELEDLTNEYLSELSGGRFTLSFVVSNDKLNVEITDNERVVDILALSSGELARVNTATLLAIRKLMSSISKSKINVLFLDEVINVLDEAGKEKIVEVLLQEELNTYLVSHQWQHPLLEKLEIRKVGNISSLET